MSRYTKDADAALDYSVDWTSWLADTEIITSHTVTAPAGLTLDSSSEASGVVTAWLSAGTVGTTYRVGFRITTSEGRTDERSIRIHVEER